MIKSINTRWLSKHGERERVRIVVHVRMVVRVRIVVQAAIVLRLERARG